MALLDKFKSKKKSKNEAPVTESEFSAEEGMEAVETVEETGKDEVQAEPEIIAEEASPEENKSKGSFFDKFKVKKRLEDESDSELISEEQSEAGEETEEVEIEGALVEEDENNASQKKSRLGFLNKFKKGLSKTRKNINEKIDKLVKSSKKLDEDFWEELEEILIQADVGVNTSVELVESIRQTAKKRKIKESVEVVGLIREEVSNLLSSHTVPLNIAPEKPTIILVVGVNGAGKTTSIAKLAYRFKEEKQKVLLAAADTFRAAAIDQLQIWADRVGVELIKHQEGSDPGAVVYDAVHAAMARQVDVLIIDTAGRLQNKSNLMKEIGKVRNIIEREISSAPHEVLLLLDATTGQNAISQAKLFEEATGVTGLVLTKLDGTAKGGIVLAVSKELDIPVKLVGIGESLEDLREFSPEVFAQALFEE